MKTQRLLPLRSLALVGLLAGCGNCGDTEQDAPVLPTADEGSGFNSGAQGVAEGSAEEAAPERPEIVHNEPPTAADFAVAPVTGDWGQYRGNNARTGLREARPIRNPTIAWSANVGVQGYANTIAVAEDAIFVASQGERHQGADERDGVYALNPTNGTVLWHAHTERDANGLTLAEEVVLVGTDGNHLIAFERATGAERWSVELDCQLYHSPAIRDGQAILMRNTDAGFATIDLATGNVQGDLGCFGSERGTLSLDDERVYATAATSFRTFDAEGLAWEDEPVLGQRRARHRWAPPMLTENMVIEAVARWPFGTEDAMSYRPAAVARWQDNGQVAWVIDVLDPAFENPEPTTNDTPFLRSMPWVNNGRVYWTPINNGALVAWDLLTGERIEQVSFPDCRSRAFGSIVGTPEMGYYARHDGMLYGFTPEPLALTWSVSIGLHAAVNRSSTHMPVQGPCNAEPKDGTALFATPSIGADGTLYVGTGDGWLYAVKDSDW